MKYTGIFRKTILVAAIAAAFASPAQAATPISGNYSGVGSTFLSGNHTLTSGNLNLDNGHTLVIEPGASLLYSGGWQRGQGWVRLDLDASSIGNGGTLLNQGLFIASGNNPNNIIRNSFGQGLFDNQGTFRKTGSDNNHVTRIDARFRNNGGRIEVQSGILSFEGNSQPLVWMDDWLSRVWLSGSVEIASGATLRFAGGVRGLAQGVNIGGGGTLSLADRSAFNSVINNSTITVGHYDQSDGHFHNWGSISTSTFNQSGGHFYNQGSVNTSVFTMSGGTFNWGGVNELVSGFLGEGFDNQVSFNATAFNLSGGYFNAHDHVYTSSFSQSGGAFTGIGNLTITDAALFHGWATQSGSGITRLQGASTLASGYFGLDAGRTLINDNTGVFSWSGGDFDLDSDHSTRFDGGGFLNHGEFIASGNGANVIRNSAGAGIFDNTGTFRKTGSSADHVTHIDALFLNAGTVAVETGSLRMNGGFINDGRFELAAGARVSNSGGDFVNSGVLGGNGVFDPGTTLVNSGTIAPGNSIGALTVLGDLTQTASSAMEFELASLHSFDTLSVFGNLTLDGVLRIIGLGGYNPGVGDSFTLIRFDDGLADASDLSGVFANVQWSGFHPGLRFDVAYHSNSLVVTAVPVPAAVWLFASGLLGVLTLGRRRVV